MCPWNASFAREVREPAFAARDVLHNKHARALAGAVPAMDDDQYRLAFIQHLHSLHRLFLTRTLLLFVLVLLPTEAVAQQIGAEWSIWTLDRGTASANAATPMSATARLGLPLRAARSVVQAGATFAPERDDSPGLLHLEVEVAQRLRKEVDGASNLFLSLGVGALRFAAEDKQAIIAACDRNPLCFYEGISYQSGWRPTLSAGLGADLPITDAVLLQPTVRVLALLGAANAGPDNAFALVRLGVGLTWRR